MNEFKMIQVEIAAAGPLNGYRLINTSIALFIAWNDIFNEMSFPVPLKTIASFQIVLVHPNCEISHQLNF